MKRFCRDVLDISVLVIVCVAVFCAGCKLFAVRAVAPENFQPPIHQPEKIAPAPVTPAAHAAQQVSRWLYAAGALCLVACGIAGYFGQVIPAVKFGLAGLCLPIIAAWFSVYWAWVVCGTLLALGVYWLLLHRSLIHPLKSRLAKLESRFAD
jgi:hypothetical protein